MARFVGRDRELNLLFSELKRERGSFTIIYGRRRVGKTALIHEFLKRSRDRILPIYHAGGFDSGPATMESLFSAFAAQGIDTAPLARTPEGLRAAIQTARLRAAENGKVLTLVFDEFPRTVQALPDLKFLLQYLWDQELKNVPGTMLIFCGSSLSMMERLFQDGGEPLYGRRTAHIFLKPFGPEEVGEFFAIENPKEQFILYAVFGGVPWALENVSSGKTLEEMVAGSFFTFGAPLMEEPLFTLQDQVSRPGLYWGILREICLADQRFGISRKRLLGRLGIRGNVSISAYLDKLEKLEMVFPDPPVFSKRKIWKPLDTLCHFWFRFVEPARTETLVGTTPETLAVRALSDVKSYLAFEYEKFWRRTIAEIFGRRRNFVQGSFIASDKGEIDCLVAEKDKKKILLACECKWTDKPPEAKAATERMRSVLSAGGLGTADVYLVVSPGFGKTIRQISRNILVAGFPTPSILSRLIEFVDEERALKRRRNISLPGD